MTVRQPALVLPDTTPLWQVGNPYPDGWTPVPVEWLASRNPRRGRVEVVIESIERNGWFGRLTVQRNSPTQGGPRIIIGNHRYRAGRALEMERFPVDVVDVDDRLGDRILLADNRSSDLAGWNDPDLLPMLQDLQRAEMLPGSGFSPLDIEAILAGHDDPEPEPQPDRRHSDGVPFRAGAIQFDVTVDEYDEWEAGLVGEVGSRVEDQIAEFRHRVGLA